MFDSDYKLLRKVGRLIDRNLKRDLITLRTLDLRLVMALAHEGAKALDEWAEILKEREERENAD